MSDVGEAIARDIAVWSSEFQADIRKKAEELQKQMVAEASDNSPVGKRGTVKYPVGSLKSGWVSGKLVDTQTRYVIGARNRKTPTVVHLINKPREHYSHGKATGMLNGDDYIGRITEKYQNMLHEYIEKKLGGD